MTQLKSEEENRAGPIEIARGKLSGFLAARIIWWSDDMPWGLRYVGDKCQNVDNFPYDKEDYPAVFLGPKNKAQVWKKQKLAEWGCWWWWWWFIFRRCEPKARLPWGIGRPGATKLFYK